jgi:hypothetical protein
MKLRLRKNSVRLRLTRTEVAVFAEDGMVEDAVNFGRGPEHSFRYRLVSDDAARNLTAEVEPNCITVRVPANLAADWASNETIGIEGEMVLDDESLNILVEKDFACLAPRPGGDDDDTFPHPGKC